MAQLEQQRWAVLGHATVTMMSAGGLYLFSAYSGTLANKMGYNNTELGFIGTANNLGTWFGVTGGLYCEYFGLRSTAVTAAALSTGGMVCLALSTVGALPRSYVFAAVATFAFSQGQGWAYMAAMKATLHNFNAVDRGHVVGCLVCFFALSSGFWASTYKAVFVHMDLGLFFLFLGCGCGAMQFASGLGTSGFLHGNDTLLEPWERLLVTYIMYYGMSMSVLILGMSYAHNFPLLFVALWGFLLCSVALLPFLPRIMGPLAKRSAADRVFTRADGDHDLRGVEAAPAVTSPDSGGNGRAGDCGTGSQGDGTDASEETADVASPVVSPAATGLGAELGLSDLASSVHFWLLMLSLALGLSFPITLVNNLATLVVSLRSSCDGSTGSVSVLVAFFAVFNCWGRVLTGLASSKFLVSRPRWQWFVAALLAQLTANLLLLVGWSCAVLYIVVPIAGLGIGGIFTVAPVTTSDIFSARHFPLAWGALTIAPCISTELISGFLAGVVADRAAETSSAVIDGRVYCVGDGCYLLTFVITFVVELVALAFTLRLLWLLQRTPHQ
jgi:hypothetical protein